MRIVILKWVVVVLSLLNCLYMLYDGLRALISGDYIRPDSGEYAGQLGPWSKLVEMAGIDPMSPAMMTAFVILGFIGLVITLAFIRNSFWSWDALLIFNICVLWYLVAGTLSSIMQIILLLLMRLLAKKTWVSRVLKQ